MTPFLLFLAAQSHDEYVAGYMIIPTTKLEGAYNQGYSMYVAVWPLLHQYPGSRFQTGLPGTWMFAQPEGAPPKDMYSDVEGGLGWWTDTRFATETPKFIMGGVGPNFSEIANGPAHGAGTWKDPKGLYGVAQLSPWLLFPLDGLNLKQGTCGQMLGYGYLNLPLLETKGNCWTLFMNSGNFKGPVAFFTPYFWSQNKAQAGQLLDARPADPNRNLQMETQYVPCRIATDSKGESYMRLDPTSFPRNFGEDSILLHQNTAYDKSALWDSVEAWFHGGAPASGAVNAAGSSVSQFRDTGYMTWEVRANSDGVERKIPLAWEVFATPTAINPATFGVKWNYDFATKADDLTTFPEYFHLVKGAKPKWVPNSADTVPTSTGLADFVWSRPKQDPAEPYDTPDNGSWKKPGPVAGPFKVRLGDGSTVTYSWYRFADQPALLNAGLTYAEREELQQRVVKLHRGWKQDKNYLAPPKVGALADLDPAQIVKPPKGFEVGYVPIATRQEM